MDDLKALRCECCLLHCHDTREIGTDRCVAEGKPRQALLGKSLDGTPMIGKRVYCDACWETRNG